MTNNLPSKIHTKKHLARLERERIQNRWIVTVAITVIAIVVLVLGYGILDQSVLRGMRPVAKVGGETVTVNQFTALGKFYRYQLIQQYNQTLQFSQMFGTDETYASYFQNQLTQIQSTLDDSQTLGTTVLNQLIENQLVRQEAKRRGITVTSEEVDKAMHDAFGYFPDGTPTPAATATEYATPTLTTDQLKWSATLTPTVSAVTPTSAPTEAATLAPTATSEVSPTLSPEQLTPTATPTEYTLEGFKTQLKDYVDGLNKQAGLTEADLRWVYENNLYRTKVEEAITADVQNVQEQVWARHILVKTEEEAKAVLDRLNKGENFAALAQELSLDTGTKDTGGDLGWFASGKMVQAFNDAAFSLKVGEISQPVKTDYGYHIIQVLGHENRVVDASAFSDLKTAKFNEWMTGQKDTVEITKYDANWQSNVPTTPILGQ